MAINIMKNTNITNTTAASGRAIKYIVVHYTAGVTSKPGSAANTIDWFMNPSAQASADFCIDDANTVQYNPDIRNRYTWHCGGSNYNNKGGSLYGIVKNANSIGIEICSTNDTGRMTNANDGHYSYTDAVVTRAVELVRYLMEQFGIDAAHVIRHYDVNGKPCPGIIGWNADSGDESKWNAFKARLTGASTPAASDMQATAFANLSETDVVKKVGALFAANMKASGFLASVSIAQFIQESGYGKSELAQKSNNCFGMKCSLSGNTWPGSSWDGTSKYTKQTQEDDGNGNLYTIMADFRKYNCVEDSIADHSAYLLGAMNGSKKRYDGLKGCTDYKTAIQIIKDGGYATDTQYVNRICALIEKYNLTQYDTAAADTIVLYRVRKSWADNKGQKGAYKVLANAKKCADANLGYFVFDENGEVLYPLPTAFRPYMVRVAISDLNIRRGPGTNYARTGQFTGVGSFTIVEESAGQGASTGWGKLKSGAGWISLDFCTQI